jgi:hypothetical protein
MSWHPYFRVRLARVAGDRHWWVTTKHGHVVHQWLSIQTIEDSDGTLIVQVILGPLLFCLAGRKANRSGVEA